MSKRAFELLLAVIEELVSQLEAKGIVDAAEIRAIADRARHESRRRG